MIGTGKTVILVLNEGRPRLINQIVDRIPAVVQLYLPSNRGGDAFADILFGDVNPSGKLPYTYPRYASSITPYFHKYCEHLKPSVGVPDLGSDYNPLWEFGHGLSYTTFEYSNLALSQTVLTGENDRVNVSVTVKNTGNRAGKEAVLLFTSDLYASIAPDLRRLRRFTKIELEPGQSRTVVFANLGAFELSFINYALQRVTEPGEFVISVAGLKVALRYR
jgi:beta-glucosidase